MASVAGLTLREAILPIKTTIVHENLRTTKVENSWTTAQGANHSYKLYLPICSDPTNKELFLYVVEQFVDGAHNDRLHLSNGPSRYSKFRQVLDGAVKLEWQTLSDDRNNKTLDSFTEDVHTLISKYMGPTSREDQLAYLQNSVKPYMVEVAEASARLTVINKLGRWLPGSWTPQNHVMNDLFADDNIKKRQLFQLMPMKWRVEFAKSARSLDDPNLSYAQLTEFFVLQEAIEKSQRGRKRTHGDVGSSGGRGRGRTSGGRGGRGYGRGRGGRGFGRGYPNYAGYRPYQQGSYEGQRNPFIAGAQGGRIPQGNQGGGRGYNPRPQNLRQNPQQRNLVTPPSPRRPMARGRGGGRSPMFPNFMADDQYYQGQAMIDDQYYGHSEAPADNYYAADPGPDDYYPDDPQADPNNMDQYYEEDYGGEQGDDQGDQGDAEPEYEDHFLQDFGY